MKYASLLLFFAIGLMLWLSPNQLTWAQIVPPSGSAICGTIDLPPAEAQSLVKEANLTLQRKRAASPSAFTSITYVPIRPHIIRQSNGTGDFSLANLNQVIAITNSYYLLNGYGIQFYFAGTTPDYIDNDQLYAGFPYPEGSSVDGRDAYNAMNQYYVNRITNPNVGGYARYPYNDIVSTRSFILNEAWDLDDMGNRLIPHELGHSFNLYHTFGNSSITDELVTRGAGANCTSAGDLICDTPADPYNMAGVKLYGGCPQYDPSSTARDANGDPYSPSITNIMSYYFPCTHDFTPGQYERMQAGLALRQTHTAYTLDAPATNVSPPTNLVASLNGLWVTLTWQDNADNEMGYFIERSTSLSSGFVPVGGVAPNATSFTDYKITLGSQYYYRIRPSNTTTGNLSSTQTITACPVPTLYSSSITRTSASLYWSGISPQTYTLQWRPQGNPNWTIVNTTTSTFYSLTGLSSSTVYEWQVQATCPGTIPTTTPYSSPQSFTTLPCQTPTSPGTNAYSTAAVLAWTIANYESTTTSTVRYRPAGQPTWTTVNGLTSTSYSLTGLSTNTAYEWQVQRACTPTESSTFTAPNTFTTACTVPFNLNSSPTASAASVSWSIRNVPEPGASFEVQYRVIGSSNWATVVSSYYGNSLIWGSSLVGLTVGMTYEWRVRTVCNATNQSDYSATATFTTICSAPLSYNLYTDQLTSTSVALRWSITVDPSTRYDIHYRPVGAIDWTTISSPPSAAPTKYYSLTGLTNNTQYEWEVRSVCSETQISTFTPGPTFTTQCRIPNGLNVSSRVMSALVYWSSVGVDVSYEVRYRATGSSDWITLSNLNTPSVDLLGLTGNTNYQWQVKTHCSDGSSSDFSAISTFNTYSCEYPTSLYGYGLTPTSAKLTWSYLQADTESRYEARYRAVGATDWITISNLTSINLAGTYVLTGLTTGTQYEWQIKTLCSPTVSSPFSFSLFFSPCAAMYTIRAGNWDDPGVWSCNRVPINTDVVQIKHLVIIPAYYIANAQQASFDAGQKLSFGTNAQLKLGL
jgi:hypothetical protein